MTDEEKLEFEREIFIDIEQDLIRKRYIYLLDITKQHREDIDELYKYNKYVTIYALILNIIMIGLIVCLILTN